MPTPAPDVSLARRIVRAARGIHAGTLPAEVRAKAKLAMLDYLSCVFESLNLPQSLQAIKMASRFQGGGVTIIGTPITVSTTEAAFVNAILGHGLVREDMHTASVSHLGVVMFPTLLAISQSKPIHGRDFLTGIVCGYEVGAAIGRAVMDAENVRIFRPTGITGPIGAALGGARMLNMTDDASVSAIGLAANSTVGLNEWPRYGADDMYFHVGFAARNAVTSIELAEVGAHASETALDGPAGLFTALRRADRLSDVRPFERDHFEILDVFHKPAGACNYAQTATQAAVALANETRLASTDIASVKVLCSSAALNYPGCNAEGPFGRVLQAKMSIRFCVAAALSRATAEESNFRDLKDPEIERLVAATILEEDPALTRAYPAKQGAELIVTMRDGRELRRRLEDLTPATEEDVRARYEKAASPILGRAGTDVVEAMINTLEEQEEVGVLGALLAAR
jgi:2-methylcitrate dehydratase PrpD